MQVTLPALIMMCALTPHDGVKDTLYRIILTHSRGQLLYIQNPSTGLTYTPTTQARAVHMTNALRRANHNARIGLAALNPNDLSLWRMTTIDGFDACKHIKLTSTLLERAMKKYRVVNANNDARLRKALAYYYDKKNAKALTTLDWAFMVMALPRVSVKKDLKTPRPGSLYTVKRSMQLFGPTPSKPKKFKMKPALKPRDLAPYQQGGPLPPVTDRRL